MSHEFDASAIAAATAGVVIHDAPAGAMVTDSRRMVPGAWFVALVGDRFDGHRFLDQAIADGAAGVVVERDLPEDWAAGAVRVTDTLVALQDLARAARRRCIGPVVGITGSSGKTTTRTLVALALGPMGPVHQTGANLNNHIGVPLTILGGSVDAAATLVEMGTSAPGEIGLLADIGTPNVRLITNVGPAHLAELGGLGGVAIEKTALFRSARPGDICCINADDPHLREAELPDGVLAVRWGEASDADIRLVAVRILVEEFSTEAEFSTPAGRVTARIPAPGHHIAVDAAAALAVAYALGVDLSAAAAAMGGYEPVGMRLRREVLPSGVIALNDAYNANPDSVAASVRLLASLGGGRVAVLGDMLELGPDEARWHSETVALADVLGLDLLVLVGPRMAAAVGSVEHTPVLAFPDPADAAPSLATRLAPGDHVLFKGSRGARVERILQSLKSRELS
ncbi:MAG: UDP-N-acetylmuramoyl-tripeptide--D-alanyl-D-alanine ligase [Myxococcota bacterium]